MIPKALLLPATISGYVYSDDNNNGHFDAGEAPIAGVTVMRSARPSEKAIARSLLSAAFVVGMLVFVGGKVASGVVDHMAR